MRIYTLRKPPFSGSRIGKEGNYVAVPEKYGTEDISVRYNGEEVLLIPKGKFKEMAETFRHQEDKIHGGTFTMGYFKV